MRERVKILNVDVDDLTMDEVLDSFRHGLLLTVNVDIIVRLQRDREYYSTLSHFDLVTCDSQVLFRAARFLGTPLKERVSGSDLFPRFCAKHQDDPNITIFICGGQPGVAELAATRINARARRRMVVGTDAPPFDYDRRPGEIERMVARINESGASVLLVALGSGRQEQFIVKCRSRLSHVTTFLPLGGTIDYEAGIVPRPRPWVKNAGLEWLYRLVREPRQRWYRYLVHQPPVFLLLAQQRLGLYRNPFAGA